MEVKVGEPLSKELRDILRSLLTKGDYKDMEKEAGVSFQTMTRLVNGRDFSGKVTEKTQGCVVVMLRRAMENKCKKVVKKNKEISLYKEVINTKRKELRRLDYIGKFLSRN